MTERILGDYILLKQIGQGSLGTVFLAEHRFMKRQYALKILPDELAQDKQFIQRFEDEVSRVSSLNHPNIVNIHNISYAEGSYFLVMDCIVDALGETTNLSQYMAEHSHPILEEDLVRWVYQIARALDYAHFRPSGQAMSHKGLKLNNILIGRGERDQIDLFLSDFGLSKIIGTGAVLSRIYKTLAKSLEVNPVVENSTTGQDQFASTNASDSDRLQKQQLSFLQSYAFLAPEQKRPSEYVGCVDRVDIYAFGVFVYYLIAKKFPEGIFQMPSYLRPQYQKNWDSIITRCLQVDPDKRPESLVRTLDQCLDTKKTLLRSSLESLEKKVPEPQEEPPKSQMDLQENKEEVKVLKDEPQRVSGRIQQVVNHAVRDPKRLNPSSFETKTEVRKLKPVLQEGEIRRPHYDPDPGAIFNLDTTVTHYQPKKEAEARDVQPILTEMVAVTGGTFLRGSRDGNRDEMPQHKVHLKNFAIDQHPITNEQFVRFLEAMGGEKDAQNNDIIRLKESRVKRSGGQLSIESGYAKHPVVGVTWYGAVAYAKWIGKRLPTEAEWEIAAMSGQEGCRYPSGEEIEKHHANFFSSDTTPVMSYPANSIGLYDMAGNVYEWCQDWYGYNYYDISAQEPDQPKGPLQGVYRVLRGGCWKSLKEDLRCSHRHRNNPGCENRTYGFRCAADAE